MIVICDKAQDVIIPAGLGDNPGVVYEKSGVESLNGQQGDLTLKTVNGNELLGEGDVAIDTGVESLNGQKGVLTLKTVNGNELTGEGNIEIQAGGVESLNGQTGALKLKTIDNKDVLGEGNMDILSDYSICMFMMYNLTLSEADKGVDLYKYGIGDDAANLDKYFSGLKTIQFLNFNIKNGASYKVPVTVFWNNDGNRQFRFVCEGYEYTYTSIDANYCDFTSKVKIGGESGGNQNVIVLDGLTQAEVKAIYDKLDKTKVPDAVFVYLNSYSFRTYWDGEENLNFDIFRASYDAIELSKITVTKTGEIYREKEVYSYTNSCVIKVDSHVNETDPFECSYIGSFLEYLQRVYNKPYAYFIMFNNGIGDSTKPVYAPFTVIWDNNNFDGTSPVRIQFIANEKLYTYLHGDTDNKWLFESAKPITGGGSGESSKTYYFFNDPTRDPNTPNAHNVEVFRAFDKAVQEGGAFNNFYIVNGNETSGQKPYNPILQVTKMANGEWGANKGYYVFAGQKSNENSDKLQVHKYCLTDIGGVIDFMVNAVDGGTWTSGVHSKIDDVLMAGADIPCIFEYLEGCDETYFWADNMGGKQGLYNITFNGGYDGYKGNVVADVYGNDTGVYMAFTVNNVRYTYKKNDANSKWELAKSVQIGGVQSSEVSNIKVLTQSEYDTLEPKDPHTMYCIKSQ